jgi:hypothetical protein
MRADQGAQRIVAKQQFAVQQPDRSEEEEEMLDTAAQLPPCNSADL